MKILSSAITTLRSAVLVTAGMLMLCPATADAKNILDIKDTAHQRDIRDPESFEIDTKKMLENWYLKNYAVLDKEAQSRQDVLTSDEEYIDRLSKIPAEMELPFNSLVKNYIEMYTQRKKQLVENMLGLSLYYMPIFEEALDRYGLPLELKYLPIIESALNPEAVSRAGATGLWQFMLPTATGLGLEKNSLIDQRCDPYLSSDAAARYLKELYTSYGDWGLALAAYNCGPGNVNKAQRRAGGGKKDFWEIYPFLPNETRNYVPTFIAAVYVMNHYDKHNISPVLARKPLVTDTVHVNKRVHLEQISDVLGIPMDELRVLNPQFRKDIIPGDIKPYTLVLPSIQTYAYVASEDSIVNHNAEKYARRDVVEPATGATSEGSDSRGRYVEETTVKQHTVQKGETLSSIAKKYGVTASSIRSTNKIGRSVKRGQKLTIHVKTRRYLPESQPADTLASNDSIAVSDVLTQIAQSDTTLTATQQTAPAVADTMPSSGNRHAREVTPAAAPRNNTVERNNSRNTNNQRPATQNKPTTYKIKSGDNLYSIAKRHGVTVDAIKRANNMTSDNIRAGQTITIPAKSTNTSKSKSSSRRRR